jgi:hypothetical protein
LNKFLLASILAFETVLSCDCCAQALPATAGETLTGRRIVLTDEVRGHTTVLVAGFSREGGSATGAWIKALHGDSSLTGIAVYQVAMLAGAPAFIRGMIKSGMKKDVPPAEQEHFVVLTQDEKLWRTYFDVTNEKDPYVVLIDASGKVSWRGHGSPANLEPQLRAARQ